MEINTQAEAQAAFKKLKDGILEPGESHDLIQALLGYILQCLEKVVQ